MDDPSALLLSRIARRRRHYIITHALPHGTILELGAFDNPLFRPELGDGVKYLDWFSNEELHGLHQGNERRDFSKVVDIDYVVKDHVFSPYIHEKFDLIVACHVVEHVADIINWLAELDKILGPGGHLFLAVPDRRYTFDFFRNESLATDIVRAHEERLIRPSKWHIFESLYYHQKVQLEELWAGNTPREFRPRFSLAAALDVAERKHAEYADVHCWCFTPASFETVMHQLSEADLINFTIKHLEPTRANSNEFWVVLARK